MIDVTIKVNFKEIMAMNERFNKLKIAMRSDGLRLGEACYKYLKTIIPVSKLNRPHLRDSFKVTSSIGIGFELLRIALLTNVAYAPFIDQGASIPTRYPRTRKAMRFVADSGDIVFTRKARGFRLRGINYVDRGEQWLVRNADKYIDFSLVKYVKGI
jgi:hypothetical protein